MSRLRSPEFLSLDDILALHAQQIERFGGGTGLRDIGLLESALAMPQSTFSGEYLHGSLYEMAAAYLFHLTKNHPFVDGNKRIGLMAALTFLWINRVEVVATEDELVELTLGVAEGRASKAAVAVFFEAHAMQRASRPRR